MDEGPPLTQSDLETLPRWARVAFAARCAERVVPISRLQDDIRGEWTGMARVAIDRAARAAANRGGDAAERIAREAAVAARQAVSVLRESPRSHARTATLAAVDAAAWAADAAADAAFAATVDTDDTDAALAAIADADGAALAAAVRAVAAADAAANAISREGIRIGLFDSDDGAAYAAAVKQDWLALDQENKNGAWTDETPAPQSVFGPMWPDRPPDGWPDTVRFSLARVRFQARKNTERIRELTEVENELRKMLSGAKTDRAQVGDAASQVRKDLTAFQEEFSAFREFAESAKSDITTRAEAVAFVHRADAHRKAAFVWLAVLAATIVASVFVVIEYLMDLKVPRNAKDEIETVAVLYSFGPRIVVVALLVFALRIAGRSYRVNLHNEVFNRRRATALVTLENFASGPWDDGTKQEVVRALAKFVYAERPTGYLGQDTAPVTTDEVVKIVNSVKP